MFVQTVRDLGALARIVHGWAARRGPERTEVPVQQGKLGIATSPVARVGRHSVGEDYFVVRWSLLMVSVWWPMQGVWRPGCWLTGPA